MMAKGAVIVGRAAQLQELAAVTGLHAAGVHEAPPPLVVVHGAMATGKSLCVHEVLRSHASDFALVDCTGVTTTRAFYREILGQLERNRRRRRREAAASLFDEQTEEESSNNNTPSVDEEEDGGVTITGAPQEDATPRGARRRAKGAVAKVAQRQRSEETDEDSDYEDDEEEEEADDDEDELELVEEQEAVGEEKLRHGEKADEQAAMDVHAYGSLNFLSFVKALRAFMDDATAEETARVARYGSKPSVVIALDNLEKLLDRGLGKLLTCLLAVNDQLDYSHVFDPNGAPWRLGVVLVARAVSLKLDMFLHGSHPAYVHFPPYSRHEVAAIVARNVVDASVGLGDSDRAAQVGSISRWLVYLYDLLPHTHNDWLEFQHVAVQMLPSFHEFLDLISNVAAPTTRSPSAGADSKKMSWSELQKTTHERVASLEKTRRRYLFGYDTVGSRTGATATAASAQTATANSVPVTSGDPVAFIASMKLSHSCLLLLLASYLASFTPHEADAHFVSSAAGVNRKRRNKRVEGSGGGGANGAIAPEAQGGATAKGKSAARKAINQQLIGPKIFELPRLLAIYASLQIESDAGIANAGAEKDAGEESERVTHAWSTPRHQQAESMRTRADIFTHLSLLIRLRLLQRASPPSDLDQPLFRCIADTRLVDEIARRLGFPLDAYLNTRG